MSTLKSATAPMVDQLRAGGNATHMLAASRAALMLDAADVMEDLLEALQAAHAALSHHPGGDNRSDDDVEKARAAIAKATGESP